MARAGGTDDDRALGVQTPPARLRAAIARHDQLLAKVVRRRQVRDELAADAREASSRIGLRLHEARALDREIHALMQGLLAEPQWTRGERRQLEAIYRDLESDVIAPRRAEAAPSSASSSTESPPGGQRARPEPARNTPRPPARGPLRALFRRLAEALHPDKVQDDGERLRRTEVMKQITVAYQEGDYARLIELERSWLAAAPAPGEDVAAGELERRIAARERAIAELEAQLAELEREIRAVRASEDGKLARAYRRHGGAAGETPMEAQAAADLERMRAVRDFIVRFRDGGLTFERFARGPERPAAAPVDPYADDPFEGLRLGDDDPFGGGDPPGGGLADLGREQPAEIAALIADLERIASAEGVHPRDVLRAIRAAAHGAGVGPRKR